MAGFHHLVGICFYKIHSYAGAKREVMVVTALILGIWGYFIFSLGLLGWLYPLPVFLISLPCVLLGAFYLRASLAAGLLHFLGAIKKDKLLIFLFAIFILQVLVNFFGAISPELSFDALWYHLTPAKLYAENHRLFFIPGWLLWPANLPNLGGMFYTAGLLLADEIAAKLIHFFFGILSAVALFRFLHRYVERRFAFLGTVVFYTMLIVGWLSTTAYVDLIRTFFEILALDYFLRWREERKESLLIESAVLTGLAMATKILAAGSFLAFVILIFLLKKKNCARPMALFALVGSFVVLPWFVFLYFGAGGSFDHSLGPLWQDFLMKAPVFLWHSTFSPDAIISPIFLIFLPWVLIFIWREKPSIKITALYFLLTLFLTKTESTRYLLPSLPALLLVILSTLTNHWPKSPILRKAVFAIFFLAIFLNFFSRILAIRKFLPYLAGQVSKGEFLNRNLNFTYGDFYDTDGWFARNIKKDDLVLVYNVHNLYYLDFPFIHQSWAKRETFFTHLLVGENQPLPAQFGQKLLLYRNEKTQTSVYLFGQRIK